MSSTRSTLPLGQSAPVGVLLVALLAFWPGAGLAQSPTAEARLYEVAVALDDVGPVLGHSSEVMGLRGPRVVGRRLTAWGCEGFAASSVPWETATVEVRLVLYDAGNQTVLRSTTGTANYWGATDDAGWAEVDDADHERTISCEINVWDYNGTANGSQSAQIPPVPAGEPSKYTLEGEGNMSGTPSGCQSKTVHYWVWRDYQVRTADHAAIPRVMKIDESFTTGNWTCAGPQPTLVEGGGYTSSYGRWRDYIYACGILTCDVGGQCEYHKHQTWKAENTKTLTPNPLHITYPCNAPSFSPW
jgi:hypothetical protein